VLDAVYIATTPCNALCRHVPRVQVYFGCWQQCPAAMAFFNSSNWTIRDGYYW